MGETQHEIVEHMDREEWSEKHRDDYGNMGVACTMLHHKENGEGDTNRHVVLAGDDAIVLETPIDGDTE